MTKLLILFLAVAGQGYTQQRVQPIGSRNLATAATRLPTQGGPGGSVAFSSADYLLGPGDLVSIIVPDLDDQYNPNADRTFRIDGSGDISLPFVGRVHAGGLTCQHLQDEIEKALTGRILKHPQVVVTIAEFHSQPVSVFGEVNMPGLHQLVGSKNLFEALSQAGGFSDNLGNTIKIVRDLNWGRIPLPNAQDDATGQYSVASLNVRSVLKASDPAQNIPLMPDDVITVSRSEVVYAVGSVNQPGGYALGQNDSLSTLQVLSLAGGLVNTAAPERAMILRQVAGSKGRIQIPVNIKQLMSGKSADMTLQADDILFIPNSKTKTISYRTLEAIAQTATGMAIYGRF